MNNTPTPRTDAAAWPETDLVEGNFARILERELTAVTKQLKAAQNGWHDEITKGLSELRRAESIYTKAQERAERAEEQRDRLAEALQSVKCELGVPQPEYPSPVANAYWIANKALQSLNQATAKGGSHES